MHNQHSFLTSCVMCVCVCVALLRSSPWSHGGVLPFDVAVCVTAFAAAMMSAVMQSAVFLHLLQFTVCCTYESVSRCDSMVFDVPTSV